MSNVWWRNLHSWLLVHKRSKWSTCSPSARNGQQTTWPKFRRVSAGIEAIEQKSQFPRSFTERAQRWIRSQPIYQYVIIWIVENYRRRFLASRRWIVAFRVKCDASDVAVSATLNQMGAACCLYVKVAKSERTALPVRGGGNSDYWSCAKMASFLSGSSIYSRNGSTIRLVHVREPREDIS